MHHEDDLSSLPILLHVVVAVGIETFGAPGEVVDAAEGKCLEDVDVSWREVDVGHQRGQYLDSLPEAAGPEDRDSKAYDNEQDQCSKIDQREQELASLTYIVLTCPLDDGDSIVDQQT